MERNRGSGGLGNGEGGRGNGEWGMGNGEWVMGNGEDVNYTFPLFHNPIWALRATRTGLRPT